MRLSRWVYYNHSHGDTRGRSSEEVHTIYGGFSGGGPTASQPKKYVRSVSSVAEEFPDDPWESDLIFTRADLRDVVHTIMTPWSFQ